MKILAIFDYATGIEFHRLIKPLSRMEIDAKANDQPFCADQCLNPKKNGLANLHNYDLITFNRYLGHHHIEVLRYMAEKKIPYVIDIDDYWRLPKHHPAYDHYKDPKNERDLIKKGVIKKANATPNMIKTIEEAIRYADGVTVATEALAKHVRPLNTKLCIIPNALDDSDEQWNMPRKPHEGIRIGYVAGVTHHNDAQIVGEALSRIQDQHDDVRVVYGGFTPDEPLCQSILKRLNNHQREMRVGFIPGTTPAKYGGMLAHLDIIIAPLENTPYNNCKSDIKVLEAQTYGLPIVCSDVLPYSEHRDTHGVILTANDTDSWVDALNKAIEFHRSRDSEGFKPIEYTRDISVINAKRLEFYERIVGVNA